MKADKRQIERLLDHPGGEVRCILLYGPDEAASLLLADRLGRAAGADAERVDLDGPTLAKDPARLADEAASSSLFGGARWIRVRPAGDDCLDAVEALLSAPQAGNPVALVAGALKPSSKLVKLALASPAMAGFASYVPDAREAAPLVATMAAAEHIRMSPDLARRIFDAAAGDRAVIARELEKLALYVDAGPDNVVMLTSEALDAIAAGEGESSSAALNDAALTGRARDLVDELRALSDSGDDGIPLLRAMLRRLLQLAALRSEADRSSLSQVMNGGAAKALFWKDKPVVEAELRRWSSADLARLIERMTAAQDELLASGSAGSVAASQELLTIARVAARER